jgi:hypothetical protein
VLIQSLLRPEPAYRSASFHEGLVLSGHRIVAGEGDALLIWNRYGTGHREASRYEAIGKPVFVAENACVGREWRGSHWYTLSRSWHNGAGQWPAYGPRWSTWDVPIEPWRSSGDRIVVLAQRGIGVPPVAEPAGWPDQIAADLRRRTRRNVEIRRHPGEARRNEPIDWRGVHAAVTWGSGAGIKALLSGVPVFYGMPNWIGAPAARHVSEDIEQPFLGDRMPMLERMSWAIWSVDEISTGVPFELLLDPVGIRADHRHAA